MRNPPWTLEDSYEKALDRIETMYIRSRIKFGLPVTNEQKAYVDPAFAAGYYLSLAMTGLGASFRNVEPAFQRLYFAIEQAGKTVSPSDHEYHEKP